LGRHGHQTSGGGQHGADDLGDGPRPQRRVGHRVVELGVQNEQHRADRHSCGEVVVLVEVGREPLLLE
jgi:hypothetical protein